MERYDANKALETEPRRIRHDKKKHGFGMLNMRMAVEKYDGVMEVSTENTDGDEFFVVEIML